MHASEGWVREHGVDMIRYVTDRPSGSAVQWVATPCMQHVVMNREYKVRLMFLNNHAGISSRRHAVVRNGGCVHCYFAHKAHCLSIM